MKKTILLSLFVLVLFFCYLIYSYSGNKSKKLFEGQYILEETGSMIEGKNTEWWLDSGGRLFVQNGIAKTISGNLEDEDRWRLEYNKQNPIDTDNGYHPQNLLRLISKQKWNNFIQEAYFTIISDNLSLSENRNDSNGIFLLNRYVDSNNLYYTGLRVDGAAVIKKKIDGIYYTLDYKSIIPGTYDRLSNPSLLPKNVLIGLRSIVSSSNNKVNIKFYIDIGGRGDWELVLDIIDDGNLTGKLINSPASIGIRTDFMDVAISGYKVENVGM